VAQKICTNSIKRAAIPLKKTWNTFQTIGATSLERSRIQKIIIFRFGVKNA
jgi:hypothetical protein